LRACEFARIAPADPGAGDGERAGEVHEIGAGAGNEAVDLMVKPKPRRGEIAVRSASASGRPRSTATKATASRIELTAPARTPSSVRSARPTWRWLCSS
jgi:hypothetical protein